MTMTDGVRRVAAGFAATGGVARGADLIEQRVLSGAPQLQFVSQREHLTESPRRSPTIRSRSSQRATAT